MINFFSEEMLEEEPDGEEDLEVEEDSGLVFARDSEIDALARAFPRSVELREPARARSALDADVLPASLGVLPVSIETPRLLLGLELTRWRVERQKELPHPSRAVLESIERKLSRTESLVGVQNVALRTRLEIRQKELNDCLTGVDELAEDLKKRVLAETEPTCPTEEDLRKELDEAKDNMIQALKQEKRCQDENDRLWEQVYGAVLARDDAEFELKRAVEAAATMEEDKNELIKERNTVLAMKGFFEQKFLAKASTEEKSALQTLVIRTNRELETALAETKSRRERIAELEAKLRECERDRDPVREENASLRKKATVLKKDVEEHERQREDQRQLMTDTLKAAEDVRAELAKKVRMPEDRFLELATELLGSQARLDVAIHREIAQLREEQLQTATKSVRSAEVVQQRLQSAMHSLNGVILGKNGEINRLEARTKHLEGLLRAARLPIPPSPGPQPSPRVIGAPSGGN